MAKDRSSIGFRQFLQLHSIDHDALNEPNGAESENEARNDVGERRFKQQHDVTRDQRRENLRCKVSTIKDAENRAYATCLHDGIVEKVDLKSLSKEARRGYTFESASLSTLTSRFA